MADDKRLDALEGFVDTIARNLDALQARVRRSTPAIDTETLDSLKTAVHVARLELADLRRDVETVTHLLAKLTLLVSIRKRNADDAITSSNVVDSSTSRARRRDQSKRKSKRSKRK